MYSTEDLKSVYAFIKSTGERNLQNMLVEGVFTPTHFQMLMKIVRGTTSDQFATHSQMSDYPRVKFGVAEMALKETFWTTCFHQLESRGLIQQSDEVAEIPKAA